MRKAKTRTALVKRARDIAPAKKKPRREAGLRSPKPKAVAGRGDQDVLIGALTDLLEIGVEIRDLLGEIRDGLVAEQEEEPGEVDTVIIAQEEGPEEEA